MNIDSDFVMTINGQAVTSENTQPVYNPATRSVFAQVPDASKSQLDETVKAAQQAQGLWRNTPVEERQAAVERFADLLEENAEGFMALLTREQGKPRGGAEWEVFGSATWLRAVATQRLPDEQLEDTDERRGGRNCSLELSHFAGHMEDRTGIDGRLHGGTEAIPLYPLV